MKPLRPASKPWWQQATALVSLSAGGAVTGFSFAPGTPAHLSSPASMPIRLMALEHAAQASSRPGAARVGDSALRSAIVNVARYYLRVAEGKTPAEMSALIWQSDSTDGADHGPSCAAFASLTLELASHVVGRESWVTGGTTYPWPLHKWADVRVEPNPDSPGITSILQDAEAHGRWHPLGDGYQPLPGDWVLFDGHVEVVTAYSSGVLHTIGANSPPDFSVNAHDYSDPLGARGVLGFVNNGELPGPAGTNPQHAAPGAGRPGRAAGGTSAAGGKPAAGRSRAAGANRDAGGKPAANADTARRGGRGSAKAGPAADGLAAIPGDASASGPHPAPGPGSAGAVIPGTTGAPPITGAGGPAAFPAARGPDRAARGRRPPTGGVHQAGPSHAGADPAGTGQGAGADVPSAGAVAPAVPSEASAGAADIPGIPVTAGRQPARRPSVAAPYRRHLPPPTTAPIHDITDQQVFIQEVAPGAMAAQRRYGVPAAVTIAQAIDESGWGQSELAVKDHNLFGIKGVGPAGSDPLPTQEYENGQWVTITTLFRVYDNVAESIDDHGRTIAESGYYGQAMAERGDPNAFAEALTGVYATSPDYGAKLVSLMQQYNLYRYGMTPQAGRAAQPGRAAQSGGAAQGGHGAQAGRGAGAAGGRVAGPPQASARPGKPGGAAPSRTPSPAPGAVPDAPAGGAAIPGLSAATAAPPATAPPTAPSAAAPSAAARSSASRSSASRSAAFRSTATRSAATRSRAEASTAAVSAARYSSARARSADSPGIPAARRRYQPHLPLAVEQAFITKAKVPLSHAEPLYRDVARHTGLSWQLLAACDWMQCDAQPRRSPVHGEKLGTVNPDGTVYRTRSEALEQCAEDLVELAGTVYGIDLIAPGAVPLHHLADAFAAFRWGGLLKLHRTSAMEFPYSVAGLTAQHMNMRWPNINEPNAPDKPGGRFRRPFGAVPIALSLNYPVSD